MEDQRAEEIWWENEWRSGRDPSKSCGCPINAPVSNYPFSRNMIDFIMALAISSENQSQGQSDKDKIMKYRSQPIEIEALKWTGSNIIEVCKFTDRDVSHLLVSGNLYVPTPDGPFHVNVGDYIVKSTKGDIYHCKGKVFENLFQKSE